MKRIIVFFKNLFLKFKAPSQEDTHYDELVNGLYKISNIILNKKLCVNGQALIGNNVNIFKPIIINGSLYAKETIFESTLISNGKANLENVNIKGEARFRGNVNALNSVFSGIIEIISSNASFKNCNTENIVFEKLPNKKIIQKIKLINNSTVSGDIYFKSGNGEVRLDSSSKLLGKVIGGRVIK